MEARGSSEYAKLGIESIYGLLNTSAAGLSDYEAISRAKQVGYNEVSERARNPLLDFLSRYWGPMPWLLEITMALSYAIGQYPEFLIIFGLLTINAIIGYHHSRSSQHVLELLKKRLAPKARVLRNGQWNVREARDLVPGDMVQFGLGDLVPADAQVVNGKLSVDQSALTGESLPVGVGESDVIYSGSIVKGGEAKAIVVNTGTRTYFGKTAELVRIAKPKSHQQQVMSAIVKYAMYVSIVALFVVILEAALRGQLVPLTILKFTLLFLMGAIPVALPAVFAIVLAVGAMQMAKGGALVTRLDAIEDAASMDLVCVDKTGTLTLNKLTVADAVPVNGFSRDDVVITSTQASKAEIGDPIDTAVVNYTEHFQGDAVQYTQLSFTPFEPATKRSEAVVMIDGKKFRVMKGAPQVVLPFCHSLSDATKLEVNRALDGLGQRGYRTLAVAKSQENGDYLQLVGLLALADSPRPDAKQTIEALRDIGVVAKMLTGDNVAIAREIAQQVSIGNRICPMPQLAQLSSDQQAKVLEEYDGLAEIYPEDKYKVVKLLQSEGHMVGMTGDGVNDSPALKQAEVGIAVSNATDVAKASASIVLTEPGIKTILDAVETSRRIYQRMLTWVINKVTKVIQFLGVLVLGFFWLGQVVLSVLGMVLLVFANDFITMSLAKDNVESTSSPNVWNVKNITLASLAIGLFLVLEGGVALYLGEFYYRMDIARLQTFILLVLVFTSQFRVLSVRERRYFWSSRPGGELILSSAGAITAFFLLGSVGIIIPPLAVGQVLVALLLSAAFTFGVDVPKHYMFRAVKLGS